jgi:hypothetical protein
MTTAGAWDCTEARPSLGVYVLGAIEPAERGPVDAHLGGCRDCRAELDGLTGLPALLALLAAGQANRINADDTVRPAVSELLSDQPGAAPGLASARPGRNGWQCLAAAAAAAAGLAGVRRSPAPARTLVVPFSAEASGSQTALAASQGTGVSATVAYARRPWGTAAEVLADHVPVGVTCQLWAVHPDGTRTQVAAWTAAWDEGRVWYAGSMPGTGMSVARFEITAGGRVLLTVRPA